jgi:S-DNA-T family DNA segregation ATPase FtsK/SpoIIIE
MAIEYIDRVPRIQPELPVGTIEIPSPPGEKQATGQDLANLLIPLITVLGFVFVSGGSGNPLFVLPMGLTMVLSVILALTRSRQGRKAQEEKRKQYAQRLTELRQEMTRSHNAQRLFYHHNYPDVGTLYEIAARKETSRFGSRLWERRTDDSDFGVVRLGIGTRPSTVVYTLTQSGGADEDPLRKDAQRLALDSQILTEAPITIPLRPYIKEEDEASEASGPDAKESPIPKAIASRHAVGIFGKNSTNTADFARSILAHFVTFHSAIDTRLHVVGLPANQESWQWAEWLPHCNSREIGFDDAESSRPEKLDQLCFSSKKDEVVEFWMRLKRELDQRQLRMQESDDEAKKGLSEVSLPFNLVVVDLLGDMPEGSPLADVASENVVATITENGPTLGAAIIFLANDASQVPSDCQALIEVAAVGPKVVFRYAEVGVNSTRYLGDADLANATDARQQLAAKIRRLDIRRSFGSDLPRSVDLLQMQSRLEARRINTVDKLQVQEKWKASILPEHSEWLSGPIGMISMRDIRNLVFSAKEGGDGVHGMIAGTTGSGKSELLLTLIASLAVKYDPRIVNFVLVDFKGGAAFEPFRRLPHCVDILTNLEANAVERMFVAIQAVMDDRSRLLAKSNAKDLVDYRKKVVPRLRPDDPLPRTFPHLFIIVDEFAEMIAANPDYKNKFESITRLGRAFGVTLILSTQRPAGVVTDQMRANMKFRICLRVETPEDSKELLGRPDAAFLPNMGGRGYIQVGNDVLVPMQVARVGGDYSDDRKVVLKDVIWLDEKQDTSGEGSDDQPLYSELEIAEALGLNPGESPTTMLDWIVGSTIIRVAKDGVPAQRKPWPDPLPANLSLTDPVDASYLNTERTLLDGKKIVINEELDAWLNNTEEASIWPALDPKSPTPLTASIGLVDNPFRAEQRLLTMDLGAGPVVLFGGAGRGKTTFIKSLLLGLAAGRTPDDLHMYALDFGRGGLKPIQDLPHLGAVIDASEVSRVDQLIRMLRSIVNERQEVLENYLSMADYNAKNPDKRFPDVVVVIDNFAEVQESFEYLIPELMTLVRDGRAFGVNFVITAGTSSDIGAKFLNLMSQRMTLTLADDAGYIDIVGRGARRFDNVPGRGLLSLIVDDEPRPVEFHVGVPGRPDALADTDEVDGFQMISQRMERVWLAQGGTRPAAELPRSVGLLGMYSLLEGKEVTQIGHIPIADKWKWSMQPENQEWLRAPLGLISSREVRSLVFSAKSDGDGVHGMVAGTTGSGKSELLLTLISTMAIRYDPRIVNFVLVDFKGGAAFEPFKKLPHCVDIATNLQGNAVERIFVAIKAEMDRRAKLLADGRVGDLVEYRKKVIPNLKKGDPLPDTFPHLFIIVDEFAEMIMANPDYKAQFESITRLGRAFGVTLILATQRPAGMVTDQMRSNMKFRICLRVETPEDSKELLKRDDAARLPPIGGRGYIQVGHSGLTELQAAWAGSDYSDAVPDPVFKTEEIAQSLGLPEGNKPGILIDWVVGALGVEAKRQGVPKQTKPWPDPLPDLLPMNLPLDATYLKGGRQSVEQKILITPEVDDWIRNTKEMPLWQAWDWHAPLPLQAEFGLVDNPFRAEQQLLSIDLSSDPVAVFGAAGRGKTTFVKSLLLSLAARHSPTELNIFALDFGRGGLKGIANLPHVGATIDASQPERVEQLFRLIAGLMKDRQERLAAYASMEDYNAQKKDTPDQIIPAVVVVIDNFAEFQESYEHLIPELTGMVRDGRSMGIYYLVTATQMSELPSKLYNAFSQKLAYTMSDPSAYNEIVGRGALGLSDIPGRGLINVNGQPLEFHVAMPVIEGQKDAYAFLSERMERVWQAQGGKRPAAELPRSVTFFEMYSMLLGKRVDRLGDLPIAETWKKSMVPENQEWLRSPIGLISSREVRELVFSAKADGDGVHGMVAGTTGSGKSELLLTLIAAMALKYDPRIVNFVLVDFKGGAAFEPFKKLPHCVDIATNLQGNAVERIFIAMKAELDRRAKLLADGRVGDLVEYRKKVIPRLKEGDPLPKTFPHLFIIVDEFAEMVMQNPEYKAQFESITRLGRAFGATLILATQRPAGMVTDQMRANMKFRICLRVETADDSKELLKRPDAATLPPLGGRGYIQIGGGPLIELQAAWAGAEYRDEGNDPTYKKQELLDALGMNEDNQPGILIDWLVAAMGAEAKRQNVPKQLKPWPDPLPEQLPMDDPIDASYLEGAKPGSQVVLDPTVAKWVASPKSKNLWGDVDWTKPISMQVPIGLIDNPYQSRQLIYNMDLAADPVVAFGAAGRGKTTFLRSLILSLCASHSPEQLHIFALDFGRGGLKSLKGMPHIGGIVDANEDARVERLLRMVRHIIDGRQQKLVAYDSMQAYNAANPQDPMPAVLVVIDNVAEFRETYDSYLEGLISLIKDGRSFGVYFAITAGIVGDVPSRLFNILGQRLTFNQLDPTDYPMIVGRGGIHPNNVPGRGLMIATVEGKPLPLEFHAAMPAGDPDSDQYRVLAEKMAAAWDSLVEATPELASRRAKPVEILAEMIDLKTVLPPIGKGPRSISAPIGLNDLDREPTLIDFGANGPHWLVMGPPMTGKTTTMRSLVLSLAYSYPPERVGMILIDPSDPARRFFNFGTGDGNSLDSLPHVLATVSSAAELDRVVKRLTAEYDDKIRESLKGQKDKFVPLDNSARSIFVMFDHYDDVDLLNSGGGLGTLDLAEVGKGKNLHFVISGSMDITRDSGDKLRRRADSVRYTLVLNDAEAVRYMGVRGLVVSDKELPPGRGYLVKAVTATMTQICLPFVEATNGAGPDVQLSRLMSEIKKKYGQPAQWSYRSNDLAPLESAMGLAASEPVESETRSAASQEPEMTLEQTQSMEDLNKILAEQAAMLKEMSTVAPAAKPNFAVLEIKDDPKGGKSKSSSEASSSGSKKRSSSKKSSSKSKK